MLLVAHVSVTISLLRAAQIRNCLDLDLHIRGSQRWHPNLCPDWAMRRPLLQVSSHCLSHLRHQRNVVAAYAENLVPASSARSGQGELDILKGLVNLLNLGGFECKRVVESTGVPAACQCQSGLAKMAE